MACEMRLAALAAKDLVRVEVRVVDEAHARSKARRGLWAGKVSSKKDSRVRPA